MDFVTKIDIVFEPKLLGSAGPVAIRLAPPLSTRVSTSMKNK